MQRLTCSLEMVNPSKAYVSFSAGKDSAVLAHAAHAMYPGIPICMIDPGAPYHWTAEERGLWLDYASARGWRLIIFPWDKWGRGDITGAKDEKAHQKAAHQSMFADLRQWAIEHGRTHYLTGMRAEESKGRRASLSTHGEIYRQQDGFTRHCPLGLWRTDDIWAYITAHDLPWLTIYDHLGPDARNGLIGRSGLHHGRMVWLRKHYPVAYREARDALGLDYARDNA